MAEDFQTEKEFTDRFHGAEFFKHLNPDAPIETGSKIHADMNDYRRNIFESLPNRTEGINTAQISSYFRDRGLKERPYILLSDDDITKLNQIAESFGMAPFPVPVEENIHYGVVSMGTDFAQIYRSPEMEEEYGTAFTEAMIVHELAHASSNWNEWEINHSGPGARNLHAKRLGQIVHRSNGPEQPAFEGNPNHGSFVEEGFAQYIANDYLKTTSQTMPSGYSSDIYSNMASKAIEEIMEVVPSFLDTLIQARNDVNGLRHVAMTLNRLKSHLYDDLSNVPYTKDGYYEGYGRVSQALSIFSKQQSEQK